MMVMNRAALVKAAYRQDFSLFVDFAFRELHSAPLQANWHIDVMTNALAGIAKGEQGRLVINAPPRSLKSFCGSIALPAFLLGNDPTKQILIVVGNPGLGSDLLAKLRRLMSSSRYRSLFPDIRFDIAAPDISLPHGGSIRFATMGHQISGRGADLIIVDDPLSPSHAKNEKRRSAVNHFYSADVATRLNNRGGAILVIMQRLHPQDLTGYIQQNNRDFKDLVLSAIALEDEKWPLGNGRYAFRAKCQALDPNRESWQQLLDRLRQIGSFQFSGQYLQGRAYFTEREFEGDYYWEERPPETKGRFDGFSGLIRIHYVHCIIHRVFGVPYKGPVLTRTRPIWTPEDEQYAIDYMAWSSKPGQTEMPERFRVPEREEPKYFIL
jgi:hypothetical protein